MMGLQSVYPPSFSDLCIIRRAGLGEETDQYTDLYVYVNLINYLQRFGPVKAGIENW